MKIEKVKHDHKWTDLLKVGIFALILLAPIFAVGVKCAYVICNRNAYQSYSGATQNKVLVNPTELVEGNTYHLDLSSIYSGNGSFDIKFDGAVSNLETNQNATTSPYERYQISGDSSYYYFSNGTNLYNSFVGSFDFVYLEGEYTGLLSNIWVSQVNEDSYLDNVFTYAVKDLANNELFNWTENTAIFTGINAMCVNLEIGTPVIAILITYWTLIVIIYVIIDILLKGFVYLTHLIVRGN